MPTQTRRNEPKLRARAGEGAGVAERTSRSRAMQVGRLLKSASRSRIFEILVRPARGKRFPTARRYVNRTQLNAGWPVIVGVISQS